MYRLEATTLQYENICKYSCGHVNRAELAGSNGRHEEHNEWT